jgi:tetratricopeptide (TPR) repeat protein
MIIPTILRKSALLFIFCCIVTFCNAQVFFANRNDIYELISDKKYDQAIYLFTNQEQKKDFSSDGMIYSFIANCYLQLKDTASAETYLAKAITDTLFLKDNLLIRDSYLQIIDIKKAQQKDTMALSYFLEVEKKYPEKRICNRGYRRSCILLNYEKAKLYEKIKMQDSSIQCLTPYIFFDSLEIDQELDPKFYKEVVQYFIDLQANKKEQLLAIAKKCIENIEIEINKQDKNTKVPLVKASAMMQYNGQNFTVCNFYIPAKKNNKADQTFIKKSFTKRLKKSYFISELNRQFISPKLHSR